MGELLERSLSDPQYPTVLPAAPDGRYWVLRYRSAFGNRTSAKEIVTLVQDSGAWKGVGYYIC